MSISRRQFLSLIGAVGGASAVYNTSYALGLIPEIEPMSKLAISPAKQGKKLHIAILGGGIAGLAAAYELEQAGYQVTILEASHRLGGRNLTLRHGDLIDELGNPQICQFDKDPNLYFNAGPARLPGHHRRIMHYCKKFDVPLQVKSNASRMAYTQEDQVFGGKPVRIAHYDTDARGFLSELLWKAVDKNRFDEPLSNDDQTLLLDFARAYGDLNEEGKYLGSLRAGSATDSYASFPELVKPMDFNEMLKSQFWRFAMHATQYYDWAEPLMEVTGGMDGIVTAFANNIQSPKILRAQVQEIQLSESHVKVHYQYKGKMETLDADYCFNNIPAQLLGGIKNNFSTDYRQALGSIKRVKPFKIGFQMGERFWEKEGIYGGVSYTGQVISQIWYPSHDINRQKGVVLGAYIWDDDSNVYFEQLSSEERLKVAAEAGNRVHANYSKHIENGISIPWGRMNHLMGCGLNMSDEDRKNQFPLLQQAEAGRHYLLGDQVSFHAGWQEGALVSAENALKDFDQRINA